MSKVLLNVGRQKTGQQDRFWIKDETDEIDYDPSKQAFEIPRFNPKTVDINKVPSNAQEYLEQVITQRLKLPKVVSGELPYKKELTAVNNKSSHNNNQTKQINQPTLQWIKKEIWKFTKLRKIVAKLNNYFDVNYSNQWPHISNKEGWLLYLYDTDFEDRYKKRNDIDNCGTEENGVGADYSSDDDNANNSKQSVDEVCSYNPTAPLISTVLTMDETLKETLIDYIAEWIVKEVLTVYSGSLWLYSLFACIMLPPSPNVIYSARKVAKVAINLRSKMDFENPSHQREIIAQNLMICIISHFLGQHDLVDGSERAFSNE